MKEIIDVKSNAYYTQPNDEKEFELKAFLEIVIIHTSGREYRVHKGNVESTPAIIESRFCVNPEQLAELITDLQLHQKKMNSVVNNADQLTGLVKHISNPSEPNP